MKLEDLLNIELEELQDLRLSLWDSVMEADQEERYELAETIGKVLDAIMIKEKVNQLFLEL
jgi:hypothetical protein